MKALLTCVVSALLLWPSQARDTSAVIPTGTATLSGTIVTDDADARPVRMATVRLSSSAITTPQTETSDGSGAFVFKNLPAGRYSIEASRAGYLDTEYGAKRLGGTGVPVVLDGGGSATVVVKLPRGAVIAGRLTGPDGEPVANVRLMLFTGNVGPTGERKLDPGGPGGWRGQRTTDERGEYRFYGVAPGEYAVAAMPTEVQGGRQIATGEIDWARRQLMPNAPGGGVAPASGSSVSLAPVLFPGVVDPAAATLVKVSAGEERLDADFTLRYVATSTISGIVLDPSGLPPQVLQVNMLAPGYSIFLRSSAFIRPGPDGRFTTTGVLPGQYVIAARGSAGVPAGASGAPPAMGSNAALLPLWALMNLTVDGRDIPDLRVTLEPGVAVTGRVVFDGTAAPPPDLTRVRVSLSAVQSMSVSVGVPDVQARGDGTFLFPGAAPGYYRLSATLPAAAGSPSAWLLRSTMQGSVDTLDKPIEIRPGEPVADVIVHFTDKPTEITGTLFGADGKPAPEFFIVVFSTDRTFWIPQSRRVRSVRPGNTGTFRIANLPPGEYYLCALTELDNREISSASSTFLEALAAASFKISLTEGQKLTQDVQVKR